jgi:hypothetical protein
MDRHVAVTRIAGSIVLAVLVAALAACDANPTSPDEGISFAGCSALDGAFATSTVVVVGQTRPGAIATFTGTPALVLVFSDGRFTSNAFASGLPPITNVGSFSISGGYVIFGERPLVPRLAISAQRFGCQLSGNRLFLQNEHALFDFGSGTFEPATVRAELSRR